MVKPADLARRPDFRSGPIYVSPARRRIEGPGGETQVEPLIMQVFLLLLDAAGQVVTRNALFDAGWGGAMVGDDSLNRAINRVRRIDAETGPGLFEIETIPRTGYRLIAAHAANSHAGASAREASPLRRRTLLAGTLAAAAGLAGAGYWYAGTRRDDEFERLVTRGQEALDYSAPEVDAVPYLRKAVALRPDSARALGLYAYALSSRDDTAVSGGALREAERAAEAALAINPGEANAHLAMVLARQSNLDLSETEQRLSQILIKAPRNVSAMRNMWSLLQCVGRSREALAWVDRSLTVAPLAAGSHYPRAQLLWITGRAAEADRTIDKALEFWPSHRYVRFARFTILAFTGRARAALTMLESRKTRPQAFSAYSIELWRTTLLALDAGSEATIEVARTANLDGALANLKLSRQAVMSLCALGDVDGAFRIANALFAIVDKPRGRPASPVSSVAWRFAPWMFIPPTAPMRSDPRFERLCDGIGLTDYWASRNVKPDFRTAII